MEDEENEAERVEEGGLVKLVARYCAVAQTKTTQSSPVGVETKLSSLSLEKKKKKKKNEEKSSAASQPLASRLSGMNARYLARKTYKVGRQKARRNLIQRKIHNR